MRNEMFESCFVIQTYDAEYGIVEFCMALSNSILNSTSAFRNSLKNTLYLEIAVEFHS